MANNEQKYYEYLVSKLPDSFKDFLQRNKLLTVGGLYRFLSKSSSEQDELFWVIEKGLRKENVIDTLNTIANKIEKVCASKKRYSLKTSPKNDNAENKRVYDFERVKITLYYSDLSQLQKTFDSLREHISPQAKRFLDATEIKGIEQIMPYIKGIKSVKKLLVNAVGRVRNEIYTILLKLRNEALFLDRNKAKANTSIHNAVPNDLAITSSIDTTNIDIQNGVNDNAIVIEDNKETTKLSISIIGQQQLNKWFQQLSVRAQHILSLNELTNWGTFSVLVENKDFSFTKFKHCGKKTAAELDLMVAEIKKTITEYYRDISEEVSSEIRVLLDTELKEFNLSVRAMNCLESANIKTLGDLVTLDKTRLMALWNFGERTYIELENLLKSKKLYFGFNPYQSEQKSSNNSVLDNQMIKKLRLSVEEKSFVLSFLNKHGFLPMAFLLGKSVRLSLREMELFAIEEAFGNREHNELKGLESRNFQSIVERAEKRLLTSSTIKAWCNHADWEHYGVKDLPPCDWLIDYTVDCRGRYIPSELFRVEQDEFRDFFSKKAPYSTHPIVYDLWDSAYFHIEFLLLFFGMTCFWINYDTVEMSQHNSYDHLNNIFIKSRFNSFKYTKALKEVVRLNKIKTEDNIQIPIKSYFVDNEEYWSKNNKLNLDEKEALSGVLSTLFKRICHSKIKDGAICIWVNKMNYSERLYEILKVAGTRLHRNELFKRLKRVCHERGFCGFDYTESAQIIPFLTRDTRIITYGKSGFWGLKEWGESYGSIRELALQYVKRLKQPIQIDELTKLIMSSRPDSNEKSIYSVIRQTTASGELLLFYDDIIGYPKAKYVKDYILMPQSFDEWLKAFRDFVMNNKRYPYSSNDGFEGYLYRWYYRSSQLTDLSAEEIMKFDALQEELSHYPHNATEYKFLHNCELYKRFVEGNSRMLKESDDTELFKWFYKSSREYSTYNDNRNKYFSQLLQLLSNKLY